MSEKQNNNQDIFGIKPVAKAIDKLTTAAINGAAALFSKICLPASEEFGHLLRDKVSYYRTKNLIDMHGKLRRN